MKYTIVLDETTKRVAGAYNVMKGEQGQDGTIKQYPSLKYVPVVVYELPYSQDGYYMVAGRDKGFPADRIINALHAGQITIEQIEASK